MQDGSFEYPAQWRKEERAKGSNSQEIKNLPRAIPAPPPVASVAVPVASGK